MSYLEELLDGVEVEWSSLGNDDFVEIANSGRKPVKASERIQGVFPYYGANNIQDYVDGFTHSGTYVLVAEDGTASIENYSIQWAVGKFWANNHVHVLRGRENLNSRFLFHYLKTLNFIPFLSGGDRAKLTKGRLIEIPIPIPPIDIQQKIVAILDNFTELTAELTAELAAELTARKMQFVYYQDRLLEVEVKDVEWKEISALTVSTKNVKWVDNNKCYKYIDLASVSRDNNTIIETNTITAETAPSRAQKIVLENDVIFATTRPAQLRLCLIPNNYSGQIASTGYCVLRANNELVISKWIFFNLTTTRFKNYVEENQSGAAYPAISDSKLKEYKIPVPSLQEQERIVSILDKFDTLTTSISEGLPKEIELRKKQYEYYRDMLLSFPK